MSASTVLIRGSALRANLRQFAGRVGGLKHVVPVVKANAYGHGAKLTVRTLAPMAPRGFAVAHTNEAIAIRRFFSGRILVLSAWEHEDLPRAIRSRIELVVWDTASARTVGRVAGRIGRRALVHAKIDSGTGRLGTRVANAATFLRAIQKARNLTLTGTYTHFADSEEETDGYTALQLKRFLRATEGLPRAVERHAACTAASLRAPNSRLDFVRVGIGLYGLWPSPKTKKAGRGINLTPALSWRTHILQLKSVPSGSYVGYGRTFRTRRKTRLAVLPVGYADGYPRALSNTGVVRIRGHHCPVAGRVSMNLIIVDVTTVPRVTEGDSVDLINGQSRGPVGAGEVAERAGTIHYELISRIAEHIPRTLV